MIVASYKAAPAAVVEAKHVVHSSVNTDSQHVVVKFMVDDSNEDVRITKKHGASLAAMITKGLRGPGVKSAIQTFGFAEKSFSFGKKAMNSLLEKIGQNADLEGKISEAAVLNAVRKLSCTYEDHRVLVVITSGAGSEVKLSNSVYDEAGENDVEIFMLCLDSNGKSSAIVTKRGLQIHFSETPNYRDEVVANLIVRGVSQA